MTELTELVEKLRNLAHPNQIQKNFPGHIKKIHFPYFKNLEKDAEIDFTFPLTVFIGQNGCGKSSALQALFGCPHGSNVGNFWFNTATDPIPESKDGISPSYWFEYYNTKAKRYVQILNLRVNYDKKIEGKNPDYWEPSRPLPKYGMESFPKEKIPGMPGTRWEGLKKKVTYLDFRAELSSFDKYFYFGDKPNAKTIKTKQDYIRLYSGKLQSVFDGTQPVHQRSVRNSKRVKMRNLNAPLVRLPKSEVESISWILGKEYSAANIVKHSFYKQEGFSVRFESNRPDSSELNYTEAFAGSGEMSVVTLVHQVQNSKPNSLILLDEPEVSLHPGAQKRMLHFLLKQILTKQHQIVICTHSPALIENLPEDAIKLFSPTPDGYFKIYPKTSPTFAFSHIGQTISDKIKIIVEDPAAKQLVDKVISLKEHWGNIYEVDFHPGGAQDIYKESVTFARLKEKHHRFLLDGNQRRAVPIDLKNVADANLDKAIFDATGIAVAPSTFHFVADSGDPEKKQINDDKRIFIQFINDKFSFLPSDDPEDTIILSSLDSDKPDWKSNELSNKTSKQALKEWVEQKVGDSTASSISTFRKVLLKSIDEKHTHIIELQAILESFQNKPKKKGN